MLASAIGIALVYHNAFEAGFVYDDVSQIQQNPDLLSWSSVFKYFEAAVPFSSDYFAMGASYYRPLLYVSFALDRQLWGANPVAFHTVNVIFHWLAAFFLFLVLRRLSFSDLRAAVAALLWASLPINSEVVSWISARDISMCACCVLASTLAADQFLSTSSQVWIWLYAALNVAAALIYEAGVLVFPVTILWLCYKRPVSKRWPILVLISGTAVLANIAWRHAVGATVANALPAVISVGLVFWKYVGWMLAPIHMSVERSTDMPADTASIMAGIGLLALIVLIAGALLFRRRMPRVSFGIAWLIVTLLPFCGIVPSYQGMAERYEYLASMGLTMALVALISKAPRRTRRVMAVAAGLWAIWGVNRLNARTLDWRNEIALDRSSLEATPRSSVLLVNLGIAFAEQGDFRSAISYYQRALALKPQNVAALIALANMYRETGSWRNAETLYERASTIDPENLKAVINLGTVYQAMGDLERAKEQYERAIRLDPHSGAAYCDLGALRLQQGDVAGAKTALAKGIELDPVYPAAYFDLGIAYEQSNDAGRAAEMYKKALAIDPAYERARSRLQALERR